MYWKILGQWLKEAFPLKQTLAILAVVFGFTFWGHYLTSTVVKPVADPVVKVLESTIRPSAGPMKKTAANDNQSKPAVPDISQEVNRVLLI